MHPESLHRRLPFRPFPGQRCAWAGCGQDGAFPAPRDRHFLIYYFFCRDHIAEYNKAWDYYRGMSTAEIDQDRTEDAHGRRPTWTARGGGAGPREESFLRQHAARAHGRAPGQAHGARGTYRGTYRGTWENHEPHAGGEDAAEEHPSRGDEATSAASSARRVPLPGAVRRACRTLGYDSSAQGLPALEALKGHYKALVRELHPDLNGADRTREEKLKRVNAAYSLLCRHLGQRKLH